MLMSLLMAAHFIGLILWLGGSFAASKAHMSRVGLWPEDYGELARLERAYLYKAALPGLAAALTSGVLMLGFNPSYYAGEGWLHAKIFFALGPVIGTSLMVREEKRLAAAAKEVSAVPGKAAWHLTVWPAVLAVLLGSLRPF